MLDFLLNHIGDLMIISILLIIVILAIRVIVKSHKQGVCTGCPYAKSCAYAKNNKDCFHQYLH